MQKSVVSPDRAGLDLLSLLQDVEAFKGLTNRLLAKLAAVFEARTYQKGQAIFHQNDKSEDLLIVVNGFVSVYMKAAEGKEERVIVYIGEGNSIGEQSWMDQGNRSGSAYAASERTVIASASFADLDALCRKHPRMGYRVMRNIAADISFRLRQQAFKNAMLISAAGVEKADGREAADG